VRVGVLMEVETSLVVVALTVREVDDGRRLVFVGVWWFGVEPTAADVGAGEVHGDGGNFRQWCRRRRVGF